MVDLHSIMGFGVLAYAKHLNLCFVKSLHWNLYIRATEAHLFNPFKLPKLSAKPWLLDRILTKPVIGPLLPSCSILKLASASSPIPN